MRLKQWGKPMESEQFANLGERLDFTGIDKVVQENQFEIEIARRLIYILFDEIIETSAIQSRTVIFNPDQYPKDKELLESIQVNGIKIPIIVRALEHNGQVIDPFQMKNPGERSFALVAGHRRVAAGQAAGFTGVEAVITKPTDDHEMLTLLENLGRRELTEYEKANTYKSFQERKGISGNKTAQEIGVSQSEIHRLFNSLNSPPVLKNFWQEGSLSATAIVILKDYWKAIEKADPDFVRDRIKGLSQGDAKDLRNQLDSGTSLETALLSMGRISESSSSSPRSRSFNQSQVVAEETDAIEDNPLDMKAALVSAIRDIFPRINEEKGKALYDYKIVSGVKDIDVIWAAALFVSSGGKLDTAMDLSKEVMSNRSLASLINRQVKVARQSASLYKKYWKTNKDIKLYLKTVFR